MDFNYEFHFFDFNSVINVPLTLMGCFMFINSKVFDNKTIYVPFFMYPEDIYFTIRIY